MGLDPFELQCSDWQSGVQLVGKTVSNQAVVLTDLPNQPILYPAKKGSALDHWQQTIPVAIRTALQAIHNPYRWLRLAALHPYAAQLCVENRVLFWLWGSRVDMNREDLRGWIEQELQQKQHQLLLHILGDRAAQWVTEHPKSALKLLHKTVIGYGHTRELGALWALLQHPESHILRHQMHIDAITERLLLYCDRLTPPWRARLRLSAQAIAAVDRPHLLKRELQQINTLWHDTMTMAQGIQNDTCINRLHHITDTRQLIALHDSVVEQFNQVMSTPKQKMAFPPPPVRGCRHIQPITDAYQLLEEGRMMRHCVGSYGQVILKGESYIYRVLEPERATLELDTTRSKAVIRQVKLKCNDPPSPETIAAVQQWLDDHYRRSSSEEG